jgi:hypothetical protein
MKWLPANDMWLTYINVNEQARNLTHDLAIDASGYGQPDPVAAGFAAPAPAPDTPVAPIAWMVLATFAVLFGIGWAERRRQMSGRPAV